MSVSWIKEFIENPSIELENDERFISSIHSYSVQDLTIQISNELNDFFRLPELREFEKDKGISFSDEEKVKTYLFDLSYPIICMKGKGKKAKLEAFDLEKNNVIEIISRSEVTTNRIANFLRRLAIALIYRGIPEEQVIGTRHSIVNSIMFNLYDHFIAAASD